ATAGVRTTVGSKVLADHVPDEDATVVERLRRAGAIVIGKENLHEFAAGVTSANPHYGAVRNPWNLDHVPGGSSGGSGANVAAGVTYASLGTDLGGSVRIPASFCGVVGMKQTYGRVSQRGLMVTSFNGDHIGPLTRSVADSALVLQAIAGYDAMDPSTVPVAVPDFSANLGRGIAGMKIGVPSNYYFDIVDDEVAFAVRGAIASLEEMGATTVQVRVDALEHMDLVRVAGTAEGFVVHEPLIAEHRDQYTPDHLHRVLAGQFVLARDYVKALRVQRLILEDFARVLQGVDVLVTPTTPIPALPSHGDAIRVGGKDYPLGNRPGVTTGTSLGARNTSPTNATGLPSLTVPCGFTKGGLPIGLQFITSAWEEALLYRVASRYEEVSPSKGKWPSIA
ncbi:MAG: Asp-tRNA(Asn)/Glu-tRNA(Gln) amidotransferase GatCAB subunit A, partial [SAR202 cluster bacterium]|nr:Asp-tRNA(Asn)/Glu-tRNA(Gln) amidotransferase GatCAB subunit A [SAR202 cluster bacterium]